MELNLSQKLLVRNTPRKIKFVHLFLKNFLENFNNNNNNNVSNENYIILPYVEEKLFVISVGIGTPSQKFNLIFDTGSPFLWVSMLNSSGTTIINNRFDETKSSTYKNLKKNGYIEYGSGSANGTLSSDILSIQYGSSNASFPINFLLAFQTNFNITFSDGILGIGRDYINKDNNVYSLLEQMKKNKIINNLQFSIKNNYQNSENHFKLYIGEKHKDFQKNSNIGFCRFMNGRRKELISFYTCRLSHIGYERELTDKNFDVATQEIYINTIFDTGTNNIIFPKNYFKLFLRYLNYPNCKYGESDGKYIILCQNIQDLMDFHFIFNGYSIKIPKNILFSRYLVSPLISLYQFNIIFDDECKRYAIFGSPFFEYFHILFDIKNHQMGFTNSYIGTINNFSHITNDYDLPPDYEDREIYYLYVKWCLIFVLIIIALIVYCIMKKCNNKNIVNDEKLIKDLNLSELV